MIAMIVFGVCVEAGQSTWTSVGTYVACCVVALLVSDAGRKESSR
jgi:hypothetical protein